VFTGAAGALATGAGAGASSFLPQAASTMADSAKVQRYFFMFVKSPKM
jgi:hypothetical protein